MRILRVDPADKIHALQENIYFDHLDGDSLQELAKCVSLREFERGETLFFEGDACNGLQIIRDGCIKLYRLSPQGRQYIVRLLQEGDTFAEVAVFDGRGNPVNAEAIEASRVWVVEPGFMSAKVKKKT